MKMRREEIKRKTEGSDQQWKEITKKLGNGREERERGKKRGREEEKKEVGEVRRECER